MHEVGGVVALHLQDQLQVVAQVVLAHAEGLGQVALVVTACYTAHQTHFRQVVEPYTVQRLGQSKRVFALLYLQDTVALERMSGLDDLQRVGLRHRHDDGEVAVHTRLERSAAAEDGVAVQEEHRIGHRHGTVLVERTSRQAGTRQVDEVDVTRHGVVGRQGDGRRAGGGVVEAELRVGVGRNHHVGRAVREVVGEAVEAVGAVRAGHLGTDDVSCRILQCHIHSGHAAVVGQHDGTADLGVLGTPSDSGIAVAGGAAVAVEVGRDRIFIDHARQGRVVEERGLQASVDRGVGQVAVLDFALQHKLVHGLVARHPVEHHTRFGFGGSDAS